jgi:flavin-dependent dehydrogenase
MQMTQETFRGQHAIVIGASMAGVLAARVLAGHFDRVTVLERHPLGDRPVYRKGVPQAHHIHGLLAWGAQIMEQLFPGLFAELGEHGCVKLDQAVAHR